MKWFRNVLRFLFKFLLYTLVTAFALVALVLVAIQFPQTKSALKNIVVDKVNEQLHAQLSIESLDGNFFTGIALSGIRLSMSDTTLAEIDEILIRYDLMDLVDRKVHIEQVRIERPRISLAMDTAGTLNFARIAKPGEEAPPAPVDSAAEPLGGFQLSLDELVIEEGGVEIQTPTLRARVDSLQIEMNADANAEYQNLALTRFGLLYVQFSGARSDTLRLQNLSVIAGAHALKKSLAYQVAHPDETDSLWVRVEEFRIRTDRTDFLVRGEVALPDSGLSYRLDIAATPFHVGEVRRLFPFGAAAIERVEFSTEARGDLTSVFLSDLVIATAAGDIRGYAGVDLDSLIGYRTELRFRSVEVAKFADQPDLQVMLNGTLFADGLGTDPGTMKADVRLGLTQSQYSGIAIDTFDIHSSIRGGVAHLSRFRGRTSAGSWDCDGYYRLSSEEYHLESAFQKINLADLMMNPVMESSINLRLAIDGKGLNPKTGMTRFSIVSDSSRVLQRNIDNLTIAGIKNGGKIQIEDVHLETPVAGLKIGGSVGLDSTIDMTYEIRTRDVTLLKQYAGLDSVVPDTMDFELTYRGETRGSFQSMETSGQVNVTNLIFGAFKLDSLFFSYFVTNLLPGQLMQAVNFQNIDETVLGDVFLYARRLDAGGSVVRDFTTSITKEKRKTLFEVSGYEDAADAYAQVKGALVMEDPARGNLLLDNLYLRILGKTLKTREVKVNLGGEPVIDSTYERWSEIWQNARPVDIAFDVENEKYDIRNFTMNIGTGVMTIFGKVDVKGDQDLDLKIKDLNLSRANSVIGSKESVIEGIVNLNASLKGSFEKPIVIADWNIVDGKAAQFTYANYLGNLQYLNRKLQVNMSLNQNADKTLTMSGYLPIDLAFKDVKDRFPNRPINLIVHSEGIDLRFLQAFFGKNLTLHRGEIKIDLKVTGNREKPKIEGEMKIEDGTVTFPKSTLGQTFRNARLFVKLRPESISLDTLVLQSGKDPRSYMKAEAKINLADLMKNFDLSRIDEVSYQATILFNDFQPVNTKSETAYLHSANLTGEVTVSAQSLSYPVVKGDLQIRNSEIWVVDPTKARVVTTVQSGKTTQDATSVNYYKNLDLELTISLPENTENAVKSAEMILYLLGDIQVIKPSGGEDFFISGNVATKPGGKYAYLNAAFTIEKGEVIFTGEPGVNPELDILAVKKFTYTDEDKQNIPATAQIRVTGKLLKPEIAITAVQRGTDDPIDGLTEPADILSYLVLGVKTSDLGKLGASQAGDFAKDVAINQVLGAIARQGGFQKLEYQSAGGDGGSATIAVSKQISETVSVSFEGGLDANSAQNLTLEIAADSLLPVFRSWKKTIEFEFKKPGQDATSDKDIINVIFYFRKEY